MAHQPMKGVKVVEVAQFTFTPAAGAVLAEWGADVIKVEHAETGDAQRGLKIGTGGVAVGSFQPLMDHPNRGKRSIGLALDKPGGRAVLLELVKTADVFLTNFLPAARRKLRIELADIRAANPRIIYARGSGFGQRGPEAEKGGFDASAFWSRSGSGWGATPPGSPRLIGMPGGAYGDSMGGMTIAGGISAALFARERTGEPSVVDISLMSVGAWAMALPIGNAMLTNQDYPPADFSGPMYMPVNPFIGNFRTADGRWINLTVLTPSKYFADTCRHLGLDHLMNDPRFTTPTGPIEHAAEIGPQVEKAFASKPFAYWRERLQTLEGQWAPIQSPLEMGSDPQVLANGYVVPVTDVEGNTRRLVANPVQFDETPPSTTRGPQFAEHTDEILGELGKSMDEILQLKMDGACT